MSRFISLSRAAVRCLSTPAAFLLHHSTRQPLFPPSTPLTLPQHHHSARRRHALSPPCIKHFHSSAAAMRITSAANPQSLPISLLSFFGCQFLIFSNLSESFATGAKHVESIVTILLQIKHLLHKRFSQQWMQVLFLMCGTVLSLILPLVQAIVIAASPDSTMINFRLIIAGGVVTGLVVKLFWARLIRPWLPTCRH